MPVLVAKDNTHFFKLALCDQREMRYGEVIDRLFGISPPSSPASERIYCRLPLMDEFLADLAPFPDNLAAPSAVKQANCGVWMSSAGNITPLHFDLCHGFLIQVRRRPSPSAFFLLTTIVSRSWG